MELLVTEHGRRRPQSRRQRGFARARTTPPKRITRAALFQGAIEVELAGPPVSVPRPRTRAECQGDERPCPWVSCKHHLYLDINPETGAIKINFPDLEPWELRESCSLDLAERGGVTLDVVGEVMNLTRERIRQIELKGMDAMRGLALEQGIDAEHAVFPHAEGYEHQDSRTRDEQLALRYRGPTPAKPTTEGD